MKLTLLVVVCGFIFHFGKNRLFILIKYNIFFSATSRRYVPSETNPYRTKYLAYLKNGRIVVENLTQQPILPKANASDITFHLFTRQNPDTFETLRCDTFSDLVTSVNFNPSNENFFIIHGWTANSGSSVNTIMRPALLEKNDANIFVVDWSGPAGVGYIEAKNSVVEVGELIGGYTNEMMATFGLQSSSFNLIGHSLGAHVCGAAGAAVSGSVNTIIGLDPAGPLFSLDNLGDRLDETDGEFVEVIHTNGGQLGFQSSMATADYFPNGGDWQPGCTSCSHSRANEYLGEGILTSGFRSVLCSSYDDFNGGLCAGNSESMMSEYPVDKM